MGAKEHYFLSGIGGSGMLPLALILKSLGHDVSGSDRAKDQGNFTEKFEYLESVGINLTSQDGSGLSSNVDKLVISAAVESDTPDVLAAKQHNIKIEKRADVLAELFNGYENRIAVGGTSGKTTVTGMIGFILQEAEKSPMMMNGGLLRNYFTDENPYPSVLLGQSDIFVTEADESDGTIALYNPSIAVLNNLALDHKSIEETAELFKGFISKADHAVINGDAFEEGWFAGDNVVSFGIKNNDVRFQFEGGTVRDNETDENVSLNLNVPGNHNIYNALAAIAACSLQGVSLMQSCEILERFEGIKRRLETIGESKGITVIDDFAHNPDKISATLATLKQQEGRLIMMFQPHGFGPLRLMGKEIAQSFADHMDKEDILYVPDVIYWGGTVNREVTSQHLVEWIKEQGGKAHWYETRDEIKAEILQNAQNGDRIVVIGARDDSLAIFARDILKSL